MNRNTIITLAVAAAIIVGGGVYLLTKKDKNDVNTNNGGGTSTESTNANKSSASSKDQSASDNVNTVSISNNTFSPASIKIKKGTTVTWTNRDSASHTVTFDDATMSSNSSNTLTENQTFSFTFSDAGEFKYHCIFHSGMTGKVTVTE